jgi:hypothetical protein
MGSRSTRYHVIVTMDDGYVDPSAFSRRADALKRAKVISQTWKGWESIKVIDTAAWWLVDTALLKIIA